MLLTRPAREAIVLVLLLVSAPVALAKYFTLHFHDLAGVSDAVVLGKIVEVRTNAFVLRPEETVAGQTGSGDLVILRFKNWTCSHRWKPYAVGQREVAFLEALSPEEARKVGAHYRLRGSGDEGEWEIRGDQISVQGFRVPGGTVFDEGEHPGQWLPLSDVLDSMRRFRSCFEVTKGPNARWWEVTVRTICPSDEVDAYRKTSNVHEYLAATSLQVAAASH